MAGSWEGGKGDKVRPTDHNKYSEGWDRIYGKKQDKKKLNEVDFDEDNLNILTDSDND